MIGRYIKHSIKNYKIKSKLHTSIKEISLDDLYDLYFKYKHKYLSYDSTSLKKNFFISEYIDAETFYDFITYFKYVGYKII